MKTEAFAHIYANGRRFIIVPVVTRPDGQPIELDAPQTVPLTLGRPTVVRLTRALHAAKEASHQGNPEAAPWDGESGRWWSHHLLGLTLHWGDDQVTLSGLQEGEMTPIVFSTETPEGEIAERLIALLGEKLHTA